MATQPDVEVTLEEARERFDELIAMVEKGRNVGLVEKGNLRGVLIPVVTEQLSNSSVTDVSPE